MPTNQPVFLSCACRLFAPASREKSKREKSKIAEITFLKLILPVLAIGFGLFVLPMLAIGFGLFVLFSYWVRVIYSLHSIIGFGLLKKFLKLKESYKTPSKS